MYLEIKCIPSKVYRVHFALYYFKNKKKNSHVNIILLTLLPVSCISVFFPLHFCLVYRLKWYVVLRYLDDIDRQNEINLKTSESLRWNISIFAQKLVICQQVEIVGM